MNKIVDIIFFPDLIKLPKESLKEICTDLRLDSSGTSYDLAQRIWDYVATQNRERLELVENRLLSGKTSVTWFNVENLEALQELKQILLNEEEHLFENVLTVEANDLTSEPKLIAAAEVSENEILLRYVYNSGNRRSISGTEVYITPKSEITTAYVNLQEGIVEVRTDAKNAIKIGSAITQKIGAEIVLQQQRILAPFGNDVEQIANALNGELIDATSTPELDFQNFTEDQARTILEILNALNAYFDDEDDHELIESLKGASETFGDHLLTAPFTALILNGMERVGMRTNVGDLRGQPLYDTLRPYLQHQGGFIKFNFPINGVDKSFTIRVGLTTDSVYFTTPATEEVIGYVRDNLVRAGLAI